MTAIPDVIDALVALGRLASLPGLEADEVLDGPPVTQVGTKGLAVGVTAVDNKADFRFTPADLGGGVGEESSIPCIAWSGSGDTVFKPHRDAVKAVFVALRAALQANRTLDGLVQDAWIPDGAMSQDVESGALVTCEFRVEFTIA